MEARKDTRKFSRIVPFCAVACVLLGACFLGLGGVRLYSLSLEGKINELSRRVEAAQEEKSLLEVRMAELMAPPRVHSSARTVLGMCPPLQIAVVALPKSNGAAADRSVPFGSPPTSLTPLAGLFVAPADARE